MSLLGNRGYFSFCFMIYYSYFFLSLFWRIAHVRFDASTTEIDFWINTVEKKLHVILFIKCRIISIKNVLGSDVYNFKSSQNQKEKVIIIY